MTACSCRPGSGPMTGCRECCARSTATTRCNCATRWSSPTGGSTSTYQRMSSGHLELRPRRVSNSLVRTRSSRRGRNRQRRASHRRSGSQPRPSEEALHTMKTIIIGVTALLIAALPCGRAAGWAHAGRWGTASGGGGSWSASGWRGGSASGGGGAWRGTGWRGGTASGGGGSWNAHGAYGGSASGGEGSWSAHSAYGGSAYHSPGTTNVYKSNTYYGGYYPAYHPPTTVNYYGSGCYNCGGWSTAGAAATGAAVGMVAGAAIGSASANAAAANAYSAGYAAGSSAYAMGAIYATLPSGCSVSSVAGGTYYLCGNTWFKPSYGANGVYYRVVPTP